MTIGKNAPRWIAGIEPTAEVLAMNGTQILELECRQQPALLAQLLEAYRTDDAIRKPLHAVRQFAAGPGPVLFLGMGGSFCSSVSGATYLQTRGRASFAVDAGEWLHYGLPTWPQAAFSVLESTSGESAELVELLRNGDSQRMALLSNNPASTGWALAQQRLPILAGPEYGNATKTYTNAAAASTLLAAEMLGVDWQQDAGHALTIFTETLEKVFALRQQLTDFWMGAVNTEVIGRGAAFGAAMMGALTLREMSGHRAAPHTGAGFKHGPNLDVDGTHVALIFALGRAAALGEKLAQECLRRGGKVILASSETRQAEDRLLPILIEAVPEPWEALTAITVAQALTLGIIEAKGCRLPPRFQYGAMEQ